MRRMRWRMVVLAGALAVLTQGIFVFLGMRWGDWEGLRKQKPHVFGGLFWAEVADAWTSVVVATHSKHFKLTRLNRWGWPNIFTDFVRWDQSLLRSRALPPYASNIFDAETDDRRVRHVAMQFGWPLRMASIRLTVPVSQARGWRGTPLAELLLNDVGAGRSMSVWWLRTSANLLVTGAAWYLPMAAGAWWLSQRRVLRGVCRDCGYNMRGLITCPECGKQCVKLQRELQR